MTVDLVSYKSDLSPKARLEDAVEIIGSSSSDLIVFSGYTLKRAGDLAELRRRIGPLHPDVLLEACERWYLIRDGYAIRINPSQRFATGSELSADSSIEYMKRFNESRRFTVDGKTCLLLVCGENSLLVNRKANDGLAEFRFLHEKKALASFRTLLDGVDVVINPLHSPWGARLIRNLNKRCEYFSNHAGVYLSACNSGTFGGREISPASPMLLRFFKNGENRSTDEITDNCRNKSKDYHVRTYRIYR